MSKNKNILIFSRELLPFCNSIGSSLRVITMATHLANSGFNVKLLGAKGHEVSYFGFEKEVKNLNILYIDDALQRYYSLKAKNKLVKINVNTKKIIFYDFSKYLIQLILKIISIPDVTIHFLYKFIYHSVKIINSEEIRILLVTSPPHSSQILGLIIKLYFRKKIKLIVDYRDGWNTFEIFKHKNKIKNQLSCYFEYLVLRSADMVLYQSPVVLHQLKKKFRIINSDLQAKSILIRNGYTTNVKNNKLNDLQGLKYINQEILRIGYFGTIDFEPDSYRNPLQLLGLLDELDVKIEFHIYGSYIEPDIQLPFKNICIIKCQPVDFSVAQDEMTNFDVLLTFHAAKKGSEEVIPGKFYEYIYARRPLLVYGPPNMECGKIVKEHNMGRFITTENTQTDLMNLKFIIDKRNHNIFVDNIEKVYMDFSREEQYRKLVGCLNNLFY